MLNYAYKTKNFLRYEDKIEVEFNIIKFLMPFIIKKGILLPNELNIIDERNKEYLKKYFDANYNCDLDDIEKEAMEFVVTNIFDMVDNENFHLSLLRNLIDFENLEIIESDFCSSSILVTVRLEILECNHELKELENILSNIQIRNISKFSNGLIFNYEDIIDIEEIDLINFISYAKINIK